MLSCRAIDLRINRRDGDQLLENYRNRQALAPDRSARRWTTPHAVGP
jgi:hypothetical protein